MLKKFLAIFKKKITDKVIFKRLGRTSYLRNGVGFGFISDEYLYHNIFLEIGFGRVTSGRGDWGGGFDQASDSPLKVTVNKDLIIQKVETTSFYNSRSSQDVERSIKDIKEKLKIGDKLILEDEEFKAGVSAILEFLPCKSHIGWDVFYSPHMVKHFTDPKEKDYYSKFPNPKSLEQ